MGATGAVCRVTSLAHDEDWPARLRDRRPDLLLVEGVEILAAPWADRLEALIAACEAEAIPRFLWITASRLDPTFRLCRRFSRIFSVDRDHLHMLRTASRHSPSLLWPGTTIPVTAEPERAAEEVRPDPVVWLGAWRSDWPEGWRMRLLSILDAAVPHGLRIVAPADPGALPADLQRCIDPDPRPDTEARLRRAKVVVATDPAGTTPRFAPKVAFDAMACGAAVISPHTFAAVFDFSRGTRFHSSWRELIPPVPDRNAAAAEFERLLTDDAIYADTVQTCRRIVAYNHTHAHRIASLASAAGIRLIPDATADPAHS